MDDVGTVFVGAEAWNLALAGACVMRDRGNGTIDAMGLAVVFGLMLWMLSLCRCTPTPDAPPPTPTCEGACKVLEPKSESNPWGLGCPEGEPSPERGVPCERWCTDYHALGYLKPWDACVAASTSLTEVRACGVRCER